MGAEHRPLGAGFPVATRALRRSAGAVARRKAALLPGRCAGPRPERTPRTKGRPAAPPAGAQTPSVRRGEASERPSFLGLFPLMPFGKRSPSQQVLIPRADPALPTRSAPAPVCGELAAGRGPWGGDPVLGLGCGASGSPRPASGSGSDDSRPQADPSFAPSPASGPVNVSAGFANSALPLSPPLAACSSPWGQGEGGHSCLSESLSRVWKALKWC